MRISKTTELSKENWFSLTEIFKVTLLLMSEIFTGDI